MRRMIRGSLGAKAGDAVVSRIVHARRVFLAQGCEASVSRRCAFDRIERKRSRQPRSCSVMV